MKSKLLFVFFVFTVFSSFAQFTAGQKMMGGQIGFATNSSGRSAVPGNDYRYSSVSISPQFSKFQSPTLFTSFGISYGYNHSHTAIGDPVNDRTANTHTIGVSLGRTKLEPLARNLYLSLTGTGGLNYQTDNLVYQSGNPTTKSSSMNVYVSGGLGVLYQLSQRWMLNCSLTNLISINYGHGLSSTASAGSQAKASSFSISTGLTGFSLNNVGIGFRYVLKK